MNTMYMIVSVYEWIVGCDSDLKEKEAIHVGEI